jgi:hypothetical protein
MNIHNVFYISVLGLTFDIAFAPNETKNLTFSFQTNPLGIDNTRKKADYIYFLSPAAFRSPDYVANISININSESQIYETEPNLELADGVYKYNGPAPDNGYFM